ncbi:MAG: hypothetical protein ACYCZL_13455, partial [Polaromonas sp.]
MNSKRLITINQKRWSSQSKYAIKHDGLQHCCEIPRNNGCNDKRYMDDGFSDALRPISSQRVRRASACRCTRP